MATGTPVVTTCGALSALGPNQASISVCDDLMDSQVVLQLMENQTSVADQQRVLRQSASSVGFDCLTLSGRL
jgi:hypothetical protein